TTSVVARRLTMRNTCECARNWRSTKSHNNPALSHIYPTKWCGITRSSPTSNRLLTMCEMQRTQHSASAHRHDLQCAEEGLAPLAGIIHGQVDGATADACGLLRHEAGIVRRDGAKAETQAALHGAAIHILEHVAVQHQVVHIAPDAVDAGARGENLDANLEE